MMADLFRGQFCFVQTEDGRVVEVYHDEDSHPEGLNLKKTIAAAFQANFRNQEEDEEQDPQSLHVTHYRYGLTIIRLHSLHDDYHNCACVHYKGSFIPVAFNLRYLSDRSTPCPPFLHIDYNSWRDFFH